MASGTAYSVGTGAGVESGVFDAMLQTLAEMAGRDRAADMIDSTIVPAHHSAIGMKRDWAG